MPKTKPCGTVADRTARALLDRYGRSARRLTGDLSIDGSDERIDMATGTMRVAGGLAAPEAAPEPIKAPLHKAR